MLIGKQKKIGGFRFSFVFDFSDKLGYDSGHSNLKDQWGTVKCLYLSHLSILLVIAKMAVFKITVYIDTHGFVVLVLGYFLFYFLTCSNFSGNIPNSTSSQNTCAIMEIESHLVLESTSA